MLHVIVLEKIVFPLLIVCRRKEEEEIEAETNRRFKKIRQVSVFVPNSLLQTDLRRFTLVMKSFRLISRPW